MVAIHDRHAHHARVRSGDSPTRSRDRRRDARPSFWVADIAPLEDANARLAANRPYLFAPKPAQQWAESPTRGNDDGHGYFQVNSPPYGAPITYRLPADVATGDVRVVVTNAAGDTLATLRGPATAGTYTVNWNYQLPQAPRPSAPTSASMRRDSILRAVRAPLVFDSLTKAGFDTVSIQRARELLGANAPAGGRGAGGRGGGGGRGGRGGGGGGASVTTACERPLTQWDPFCPRPGEGALQGPRGAQGPFTSPLVVNNADPKKVLKIFRYHRRVAVQHIGSIILWFGQRRRTRGPGRGTGRLHGHTRRWSGDDEAGSPRRARRDCVAESVARGEHASRGRGLAPTHRRFSVRRPLRVLEYSGRRCVMARAGPGRSRVLRRREIARLQRHGAVARDGRAGTRIGRAIGRLLRERNPVRWQHD